VVQDRGRNVEQDREKVEEPEIAAGGTATKDGIVAQDMANSFIHAPSMAYRCKLEVRNHLNCTRRTLAHADAAALAVVQIDFKTEAWPQLLDRIVGTDTEAVIALEAVAAGHAATGFIQGG